MIIQKKDFKRLGNYYTIYIFEVRYVGEDISHVKYFFKKEDGTVGEFVMPVEQVARCIYLNQWQAWAGLFDKNNQMFDNAAKVVPGVKNGKIYLTTISDDYKSNNLENLPRF